VSAYPFIEAEKAERRNVAKACELMEVSRSACYQWQRHQPSRREVDDQALHTAICGPPDVAISTSRADRLTVAER